MDEPIHTTIPPLPPSVEHLPRKPPPHPRRVILGVTGRCDFQNRAGLERRLDLHIRDMFHEYDPGRDEEREGHWPAFAKERRLVKQIVTCSGAGAHKHVATYARKRRIPLMIERAEHMVHIDAAYHERNIRMLSKCDELLILIDEERISAGLKHPMETLGSSGRCKELFEMAEIMGKNVVVRMVTKTGRKRKYDDLMFDFSKLDTPLGPYLRWLIGPCNVQATLYPLK